MPVETVQRYPDLKYNSFCFPLLKTYKQQCSGYLLLFPHHSSLSKYTHKYASPELLRQLFVFHHFYLLFRYLYNWLTVHRNFHSYNILTFINIQCKVYYQLLTTFGNTRRRGDSYFNLNLFTASLYQRGKCYIG